MKRASLGNFSNDDVEASFEIASLLGKEKDQKYPIGNHKGMTSKIKKVRCQKKNYTHECKYVHTNVRYPSN